MITHIGTVEIITERLKLRRFTTKDVPAMFNNWASDPLVTRYITWDPHTDVEFTKKHLARSIEKYEREDFYYWAVEFEEEVIGTVGGSAEEECGYDIGYCIGQKWWNRGIMTEAVCAVIDFAFQRLSCDFVSLSCIAENKASARVAEKCGMSYIGTETGAYTKNGITYDLAYYRIERK